MRDVGGGLHAAKRARRSSSASILLCCVLGSSLAACAEDVAKLQAPPSITHVAILELEETQLVSATPLLPITDGAPLSFDRSENEHEYWVLGFEENNLLEEGVSPATLTTETVALAGPCDPLLPSPSWAVRARDRSLDETNVAEAPALTAKWIEDRCRPIGELDIDLRCVAARCLPETRAKTACRTEIVTIGCSLGTITLSYDRSSLRCLELSGGDNWQCDQVSSDAARSSFTCGPEGSARDCPVELISKDRRETPELEQSRVDFGLLPPAMPELEDEDEPTLPRRIYEWGQGFEVLPLGDRVIVTAIAGSSRAPCPDGTERRLVFIDREQLAVTGTATAPRCLEHLASDGDGFVGGFKGPADEVLLGRFDRDGRLSTSVVLSNEPQFFVNAIHELEHGFVVLLDKIAQVGIEDEGELVFLGADLMVTGRVASEEIFFGLGAIDGDRAVIWSRADIEGSDILIFDNSGDVVARTLLPLIGGYRPTSSIALGTKVLMFSTDDKESIAYELEPFQPFRVFGAVGGPGYVVRAAPWIDGRLVIAGGARGDPKNGYQPHIFFIDPIEGRFLAGGTAVAGIGPITSLRGAGGDEYWMLLPWEGAAIRVRRPR